ncbi:MAG: hypothetical protein ACRD96_02425, partial [Bryobacteraceae bacterium]
PQANLALVWVTLKRHEEAESAARRALRLDPLNVPASYALGLVLLTRNQCTPEAVAKLRIAAEHFERARLSLARLLVCRGETHDAAAQLRTYLDHPGAQNRDQVQSWLAGLQSPQP